MKLSYKNVLTLSTKLVFVGLLALSAISCSKEKNSEPVPTGETVLTFTVSDVKDLKPNTVASVSTGKSASTKGTSTYFQSKDGGFDAILEVTSNSNKTNFGEKVFGQNTPTVRAASGLKATAMPTTAKYRLLLYNEQNTVLKKEVEVQSGSSPQIPVDAGVKYNWYAVSTNEGTTPTVTNGVISKSALSNKDVLYASGTITPQFGVDNKIPITFQHLNVAYSVSVDSRGNFSSINDDTQMTTNNSFPAPIFRANLNLFSGTYTGLPEAIPSSELTSNMTATTSSPATSRPVVKNVVYYSSMGSNFTASSAFSVLFNKLSVTLDDGSQIRSSSNFPFSFAQTVSTTAGSQYNFNVQLLPGGSIVNGNNIWAPTNLVYVPGQSGNYAYRFRASNAYAASDPNELWQWNTLSPDGSLGSGDPCQKVYPENTWRTPAPTDFLLLNSTPDERYVQLTPPPGIFGTFTGAFVSRAYVAWQWRFGRSKTVAEEVSLSNPTTLIFPFNGYMAINTITGQYAMQQEPVAAGLGVFYYSQGHYWTSGYNTYQLMRDDRTFVFASQEYKLYTIAATTERRNIRCIRTKP